MNTTHSLSIKKTISAPVGKVFNAWVDPDVMCQWMGPGEVKCKNVDIDFSVGGSYAIHMVSNEGDHIAVGTYKEIVLNEKLQYTWTWQNSDTPDTLVTIEFRDVGASTELTLIHEQFASADARDHHEQGWIGCLVKLEAYFNTIN